MVQGSGRVPGHEELLRELRRLAYDGGDVGAVVRLAVESQAVLDSSVSTSGLLAISIAGLYVSEDGPFTGVFMPLAQRLVDEGACQVADVHRAVEQLLVQVGTAAGTLPADHYDIVHQLLPPSRRDVVLAGIRRIPRPHIEHPAHAAGPLALHEPGQPSPAPAVAVVAWFDDGPLIPALREAAATCDSPQHVLGRGLEEVAAVIAGTDTSARYALYLAETTATGQTENSTGGGVPVGNLVAEALVWLLHTSDHAQRDGLLRLTERLIDRGLCTGEVFHHLLLTTMITRGARSGFLPATLHTIAQNYAATAQPEWADLLTTIASRLDAAPIPGSPNSR